MNLSYLKIKDFPSDERPRERLIKNGPNSLSTSELLAIVLGSGTHQQNVIDLSKNLLNAHNLKALAQGRVNALITYPGIGEAKACKLIACFELGKRLLSFTEEKRPQIDCAEDVVALLSPELESLHKEHVVVIFLDARKKVLKEETIFIGSLDTSVIHPREIFKAALLESAAAIILVHNHPSGDPKPSNEDIEVTSELSDVGKIIGIELIDHIIIGKNKYASLREKGFF